MHSCEILKKEPKVSITYTYIQILYCPGQGPIPAQLPTLQF